MDIVMVRDEEDAEKLALSIRSKIDSLEVVDKASYDLANDYNIKAYQAQKNFHKWDDPVHDPIAEAWSKSCARRKKVDDACKYIIKETGSKAAAWMRAEKAKADEVRRIAEEAARREAEEAQIRAAEALQSEGLFAASEAVLDAPVVTQKVEVAMPEKSDGVSYRDVWGAEVVSLMELVKAVAAGKAPLNAIQANESYLGQWARMSKGTESLPGVKVTNTPIQVRRL